jgi:hypothetical protein
MKLSEEEEKELMRIQKGLMVVSPFQAVHQYRRLRTQARNEKKRKRLDLAFGEVYDRDLSHGDYVLIGGDRLYVGLVPGSTVPVSSRISRGIHQAKHGEHPICVLEETVETDIERMKTFPVALRSDGVLECLGFLHYIDNAFRIYEEISHIPPPIHTLDPKDDYYLTMLMPIRLDKKHDRNR